MREQFLAESHLDLYRVEDLERQYRQARGLETPSQTNDLLEMED